MFLAGLGGYLVLNSRLFHGYVVRTALQTISDVTGTRAEIGSLDLHPLELTVIVYDLRLHGSEEPSQPPLLSLDKLSAKIGVRPFSRRQITLDAVSIDHPIVHMLSDTKGTSNFPRGIGSGADNSANKFSLSISHLLITRGELTYRDGRIPLDADVHDLAVEANRDLHSGHSRNSISYRDGFLHLQTYPPVRHNFTATFITSPSHISLEAGRLSFGASVLSIRGELDNLSHPQIMADYDVRLHTGDLGDPWGIASTSAIVLSGQLKYVSSARPALLNLSGTGQLSSDALTLSTSAAALKLDAVRARYELANGTLQLPGIQIQLLEGQAIASVKIEHLENTPAYELGLSLSRVSLQKTQQAVRNKALTRLPLRGILSGTVDGSWTGTINNIVSHSNLQLAAPAMGSESDSGIVLPVAGAVNLTYIGSQHLLTIQNTNLHVASMSLELQGDVGDRSHLNIRAAVDELQSFAKVLASFGSDKNAPIISGSAQLTAEMYGPPQSPHLVGALNSKNLVIRSSKWSSVSATFELSPSRLSLESASLVNAHQGSMRINGDVELYEWSYIPSNLKQIDISLHTLPIAELQNIVGVHYADKGEVSGDVSLHGFASDLTGSGTINILNAQAYEEPLQKITAHFLAKHGSVSSTLDIRSHAGSATANLSFLFPGRTYDLRLNATRVVLQELWAFRSRDLPIRGLATVSVSGEGSLDNPKLDAAFSVDEAEFRGTAISQIQGKADLVGQRVDVECRSQIAGGSVQMRGHANLVGDYYAEAAIDSDTLRFDRLQYIYLRGSPEGLQGETEFHLNLKGPLRRVSQLEGQVSIPTLRLGYESLWVRAVNPIRLDFSRSLLTLEPAEFQGSGTSFQVQGNVPLQPSSLLDIRATGSIDAVLLRMFVPDVKSSGSLSFDVHTIGARSSPSLQGQILLKDVAVTTPTAPLGIDSLSGALNIDNGKLRIVNLSGKSGDGELSLSGTIVYQPHLQFDVTLQAKGVRLRYAGVKVSIDSELALVGRASGPTLRGKASVAELSLAPDLDLAMLSERLTQHHATRQAGVMNSIKLVVLLQSTDRLKASNSQLSVEGNLNLQLIGTAADPVIVGRMDLTSAEFLYRARRYQLQRGFVVFDNPHQTRPTLDVSVTTTVQQYNLTLAARGPLEKLTTSYVSDPPLPTADIISLVAFGNTTQTTDAAGHGADSILASQAGGQLSSKMQGLTGISGLRIDPLVGGSNRNPSARIAIQQRVTKNFLFTFSTDVSQPGSETVEGKYQINKRWSVGVARDPVGGISVDGRYHTRF